MRTSDRVRAMRANGEGFSKISRTLGISPQWAYKCASGTDRGTPAETPNTIVRSFPHNGGCSTLSGMMPVSLPRIVALHGEVAV